MKISKKTDGFHKFALFPTRLTSGEYIWLRKYFIGGKKHGVLNRYSVGHKKYELLYSNH